MSLNERVLAALERHWTVTRAIRWFIQNMSEDALRVHLRIAFHEIGEVLRHDELPPGTA